MEYKEFNFFWFSNKDKISSFWFNSNQDFDDIIKDKYYQLLIAAENHKLNHWKTTPEGHLLLIIVLDQLSRHIYRDSPDQFKNDTVAYYNAKEFILENKDKDLTIPQRIMLMMPFRHQSNINDYEFVINYMKDYNDSNVDKFLYQTIRRYNTLKDIGQLPDRPIINLWTKNYDFILENNWNFTIKSYKNDLYNVLEKFIQNNINYNVLNTITVSLSGGVDSMVILYILKQFNIPDLIVNAIHLDYGNRDESSFEAEFLMKWCKFINVDFYYKYINEVQRKNTDREIYENLTTNIRFDFYKKIINNNPNHLGIILGHHLGDIQENVFFNFIHGKSLLDLTVMKEQMVIKDVKILRPLLNYPKSLIYDYANNSNIPYFKNTTPLWSNRGKYREKLLPEIIKTFGEGSIKNLQKISKESDELKDMILEEVVKPYLKQIKKIDKKYELPLKGFAEKSNSFWKYIFLYFCIENNLTTINNKVLINIIENIKTYKKFKIKCNENMTVYIDDKIIIHIN
jgi:tRNA(Ile)-lysidine synthetase-like protein